MGEPEHPEDLYFAQPGPAQVRRLRQFFRFNIPYNYVIVALMIGIWIPFRFWSLLVIAAGVAINVVILHWSRAQLEKNRLETAALGIAAGVILTDLAGMFLSGGVVLPILAVLTLWPVMIALPYLRKRSLLQLMFVSTGCALALGLMAFTGDSVGLTRVVPVWVWMGVNAFCLPLFIGFLCMFVWHYSSNLAEALAQLRSANSALQSSERSLEQKVADRTAELARKNEELLKLDQMKTQFVSNASHELRSPLTSIRAFSEMLATDPTLDQTQAEFATIINAEAERLTRLATDLLDLSRMEAGYVDWNPRPLDVRLAIVGVYETHRPRADAKGVQLQISVSDHLPLVCADPDGLHRVLVNLVDNGLKFTATGSVEIKAAREGERVCISVCDTGPGISEADQALVFERFYQAGNVLTEKPTGAGLGLAICREILFQHQSQLELRSTLGKGSCFSFELPLWTNAPNSASRRR